jgi:hypothetical protein
MVDAAANAVNVGQEMLFGVRRLAATFVDETAENNSTARYSFGA